MTKKELDWGDLVNIQTLNQMINNQKKNEFPNEELIQIYQKAIIKIQNPPKEVNQSPKSKKQYKGPKVSDFFEL